MTPQLMQAIKLLQLSNLDLAAYVEGELERNPLLERDSEGEGPGEPERRRKLKRTDGDAEAGDWMGESCRPAAATMEAQLGTGLDNVFPEDSGQTTQRAGQLRHAAPTSEWAGTGPGGNEHGDYNLEAFVSAETTLADHLAEQLSMAITDPARRMIGQYLIDMVDEAGYLAGDLETVAQKLGAPMRRGGSRARRSCRASTRPASARAISTNVSRIQLRERDRFDPAMRALVENLPMLANRQLAALKKICGVDEEDLADMIARNPAAQSQARPRLRLGHGAADHSGCVRAARRRWRLAGGAQFGNAAESAGQPELLRQDFEERARRR